MGKKKKEKQRERNRKNLRGRGTGKQGKNRGKVYQAGLIAGRDRLRGLEMVCVMLKSSIDINRKLKADLKASVQKVNFQLCI